MAVNLKDEEKEEEKTFVVKYMLNELVIARTHTHTHISDVLIDLLRLFRCLCALIITSSSLGLFLLLLLLSNWLINRHFGFCELKRNKKLHENIKLL